MSCLQGSSPLTRGKYIRGRNARRAAGLIPAHAGKMTWSEVPFVEAWAHPRSRGENISALPSSTRRMGSSPLTRGKCQPARRVRRPQGLIPAHAGKIGRGTHGRGQRGAHPRSRGENLQRENCSRADQGSSPLTRGKYGGELGVGRGGGLIPAHAGKIRNGASPASHAWAHPRSRGENACGFADGDLCGGSSPLTRGKCRTGLYQGRRLGLIPAHAGKITHDQRAGHRARLIPAHAGKISDRLGGHQDGRAHPRSRGENA